MPRATAAATLAAAKAAIRRGANRRAARAVVAGRAEPITAQRRELPGPVGGGQHPLLHPRRRLERLRHREPGRGLAQAADLRLARRAVLQVALEFHPLRIGQGIQGVAAGEHVPVVGQDFHHVTSMQSRILINPSLILVFTVPRATPSRCATCG